MIRQSLLALGLAAATLSAGAPAVAQEAASPADAAAAGGFIQDLTGRAFGVLRDRSIGREATHDKFRALLRQNFALTQIGENLIRRFRPTITPAQLAAYQAALPTFIVNAYTDRLSDFSDAQVKVIRSVPLGSAGTINVYAQVTNGNRAPIDTIWTVRKIDGRLQIVNMTVSGINLALTQRADFEAYVQKNGFDALVTFLQRGGK